MSETKAEPKTELKAELPAETKVETKTETKAEVDAGTMPAAAAAAPVPPASFGFGPAAAAASSSSDSAHGSAGGAAAAATLTPSQLALELMVSLLLAVGRLGDVTRLSAQGSYPMLYACVNRLASHENPRIKETASNVKAKLPVPYGFGASGAPITAGATGAATTTAAPKIIKKISASGPVPLGRTGPGPVPIARPSLQQLQQLQHQNAARMLAAGAAAQQAGASMQQVQAAMQSAQQPLRPGLASINRPGAGMSWNAQQQQPHAPHPAHQPQQQQPVRRPYQPIHNYPSMMQHQQQPQQQPAFSLFDDQYDTPVQQAPTMQQQPMQPQQQPRYPLPPSLPTPPHPSQHMQQQQHPSYGGAAPYPPQQPQPQPPALPPPPHPYAANVVAPVQPPAPSTMHALSALTAMLNPNAAAAAAAAPVPAAPVAAAPTPSIDVSQLSSWLTSKLAPAAGSASTANALSALLAKVQGAGAPAAAAAAAAAPAPVPSAVPTSFAELQSQESTLQGHLRHWDDQYRLLWPQHNDARQAIGAINGGDMMSRLQRLGELSMLEQRADQLANQLRQVQANQAQIKTQIAECQQRMQQMQQQQQQQQAAAGYVARSHHTQPRDPPAEPIPSLPSLFLNPLPFVCCLLLCVFVCEQHPVADRPVPRHLRGLSAPAALPFRFAAAVLPGGGPRHGSECLLCVRDVCTAGSRAA